MRATSTPEQMICVQVMCDTYFNFVSAAVIVKSLKVFIYEEASFCTFVKKRQKIY